MARTAANATVTMGARPGPLRPEDLGRAHRARVALHEMHECVDWGVPRLRSQRNAGRDRFNRRLAVEVVEEGHALPPRRDPWGSRRVCHAVDGTPPLVVRPT